LPLIPNLPTQELSVAFSDTATGLPTAQLSAVANATVAGAALATSSSAPIASAFVTNSPTDTSAHAAPARTWWEHWSSGIVLIVLLIALATASILAWQGGGKPNEKLLADTEKPSESLSDLSAIEVPKLDIPKLDVPSLAFPTLKPKPASGTQASLQHSTFYQGNATEVASENTSEDAASLIPSGPIGLSFGASSDSTNSALQPETMLKPEPHATASLQSPVVKPQEPLFKDEPTTARATISAQPASTPNSMNSSTSGGSPAIWDSSSIKPTDKTSAASQGLSLELSSPTKAGSASNTLGTASKPVTATNTPGMLISHLTTAPTSTTGSSTNATTSSPNGTAVPTNLQYAGKTTTPELDRAALIATFRQYSSSDIMGPPVDATANRYKTTAPTTSTLGPQSQAGVAASMVGFNQQPLPTQQPIQQQPSQQTTQQTNYTLQSPLQNQTPQYQHQYQPNQYQQPQYQNQYPQTQNPQGQYQQGQYQLTPNQQMLNQQTPSGAQTPTSQQFAAPYTGSLNTGSFNTGINANTGNGYYIPPTVPTHTQPNIPTNTLSYPSLK